MCHMLDAPQCINCYLGYLVSYMLDANYYLRYLGNTCEMLHAS